MSFNNLFSDVQANAKPWIRFEVWLINLIESLKNPLLIVRSYADAKVLHAYDGVVPFFRHLYKNLISLWRIFDGIGEQIDKDLPHAVSIAENTHMLFLCGGVQYQGVS